MSVIFNSKTNYRIDTTKPPLGPPTISKRQSLFGEVETKESIKETTLWEIYSAKFLKESRRSKND